MKNNKLLLFGATGALVLAAGSANAAVLAFEDFSYADGNLVGKGAAGSGWNGAWVNQFGSDLTRISVANGVVVGQTTSTASQRMNRQLDASVTSLTNGTAANNGITIYIGVDYRFGLYYGGFELIPDANQAAPRMQLGSRAAPSNPSLFSGSTVHVPTASIPTPTVATRYVMAITYNNTTGDMVSLYGGPAGLESDPGDFTLLGSSTANVNNDFSFQRVGFGVFIQPNGSIPHADNLVIGTTFASVIPEPSTAALAALGGLALLRRRRR
jgi:hypothetical protein